jgi:uncharacterized membrane protein
MDEEPPGDRPASSQAPADTPERKTPETDASGVAISDPGERVIVASTTPSGADIQEFPGSPDFSLTTMVDGDSRQIIAASYEGILPPPSILRGYDEIVPGSAKGIISWVSQESKHRRTLEIEEAEHRRRLEKEESEHRRRLEDKGMALGEKALGWGIFRANAGMLLAWPLIIGIVAAGAYLIHEGHDWAGTIMVESALAIVVGAFVLQRIERFIRTDKEKSEGGKGNEA